MIALVGGEHEQRIALMDPGCLEVGKKFPEGCIVIMKLFHVRRLAGTESVFGTETGPFLIVMSVGDVGENDRDALLQHRLDHRERLCRNRIEAGETVQRVSIVIVGVAERGVNVLRPEQRLVSRIAARWLTGQRVLYSAVGSRTKCAA